MRIRFATQSYKSDSKPISQQRCVNMYAEAQPANSKTDVAVIGSPGVRTHTTCGVGPIRGGHEMGGVAYVVSGAFLYSFDENGVAAQLGGQISGSDIVSMDDNGDELTITNGTNGYVYSATSGFQLITSTNFHAANTTSFIDSFMAFDRAGTNEYFLSDSGQATSFSDLFASAESRPDNILSVFNHLEVLHLFGAKTIELHQNAGAANMPFQRIPGGLISRGIAAPHAFAMEDSAVHILGEDRMGYRLNGTSPQKISTFALDSEWSKYSTVDDAHCFAYSHRGHKFVHYNFPTANTTFVFDIASKLWHERESFDRTGNSLGRWRGNCAFTAYGKTFIGDAYTGKVGYIDDTIFTEFDDGTRAELISPPIMHPENKMVFMPWFELYVEPGVGLISGQGQYPQYMLDISDDGGNTWDGAQLWQSAGVMGNTRAQLRFDRLGSFYERSLKVTISDPVKRVVYGAACPGLYYGI
jgi:hypothetical protein